jgi:hypothetical protein
MYMYNYRARGTEKKAPAISATKLTTGFDPALETTKVEAVELGIAIVEVLLVVELLPVTALAFASALSAKRIPSSLKSTHSSRTASPKTEALPPRSANPIRIRNRRATAPIRILHNYVQRIHENSDIIAKLQSESWGLGVPRNFVLTINFEVSVSRGGQ